MLAFRHRSILALWLSLGLYTGIETALAASWTQLQGGSDHAGMVAASGVSALRAVMREKLPDALLAGATVDGERVFVPTRNGTLYCLARADAAILWSFSTGGRIDGQPAVDSGRVFFTSQEGYLYALEQSDGRLDWTYPVGKLGSSQIAISAGRLFVGSVSKKSLLALNTGSGALDFEIPFGFPVMSTPAISGNDGVVAHNGRKLVGFDPTTGQIRWSLALGSEPGAASPAIGGGVVYFAAGGTDPDMIAVAVTTGVVIWRVQVGTGAQAPSASALRAAGIPEGLTFSHLMRIKGGASKISRLNAMISPEAPSRAVAFFEPGFRLVSRSAAIGSDSVYLTAGFPIPRLLALRKSDGALRFGVTLDEGDEKPAVWPSPVVWGNLVLAADAAGSIRLVDAATGSLAASFGLTGAIFGSLTVENSRLFATTADGYFFQYEPDPGTTGDVLAPTLTLLDPRNGSTVASRSPELVLRASDGGGSGVDFSRTVFTLDATAVAPAQSEYSGLIRYRPAAPLPTGTHASTVEVRDRAGNLSSLSFSFVVPLTEDTTAPLLANPSPPEGFRVTSEARPRIGFLASDLGTGVDPSTVGLYLNGIPMAVGYDPASGIALYRPAVALPNGVYEIRGVARDRAGNQSVPLVFHFTVSVVSPLESSTADQIRVLNLTPGTASIAFRLRPPAVPSIRYSTSSAMTGSSTARGPDGTPSSRSLLTIGPLPADSDVYFEIDLTTATGTSTVRDKDGPFHLRTPTIAASASPSRPLALRAIGLDGLGIAGVLATLTGENDRGVRTTSLGAITPATGSLIFNLGDLREWDSGQPYSCVAGDRVVLTLRSEDGRSAVRKLTLDGNATPLDLGDLRLQEELPYTVPLRRGLNLISFPTRPATPRTAFDVLAPLADAATMSHWNALIQAFETATRLFGTPVGTPFTLDAAKAYFLFSPAAAELLSSGSPPDDPAPIGLEAGLNPVAWSGAVGFPDDRSTGRNAYDILSTTPGATEIVRFDPELARYRSAFVTGTAILGERFPIVSGEGYYLRTTVQTTLTPEVTPLLPRPTRPVAAPAAAAIAPDGAVPLGDALIANVTDRSATVIVEGGRAGTVDWRAGERTVRQAPLRGRGRFRSALLHPLVPGTRLEVALEDSRTLSVVVPGTADRPSYIVHGRVGGHADQTAGHPPVIVSALASDGREASYPLAAFADARGIFYVNLGDLRALPGETGGADGPLIRIRTFGREGSPLDVRLRGESPEGPVEVGE